METSWHSRRLEEINHLELCSFYWFKISPDDKNFNMITMPSLTIIMTFAFGAIIPIIFLYILNKFLGDRK